MRFADIHNHALFGVDDGAKTLRDSLDIISSSYEDGVRYMCLTPHFNPRYFGDNIKKAEEAFEIIKNISSIRFPEMSLFLANELRFDKGCLYWLGDGMCKTINKTRTVLVDFAENEDRNTILNGVNALLNMGYKPLLAHAERYLKLKTVYDIQKLKEDGVLIQLDTQSVLGDFGWTAKKRSKLLLSQRLADIISSDAHNMHTRVPGISECYKYIYNKYGDRYSKALCLNNALKVLDIS